LSASGRAARSSSRFPLAPTRAFNARVEERDHTAVVASLRPFFEPSAVAVIGASRRRGSIGGELFRNILQADFAGAAYPVNRNGDSVAGCARLPRTRTRSRDAVDLAVICLPASGHRSPPRRASPRGARSLRHLAGSPRPVPRDARARSGCSRSYAPTARAWSAPTAWGSPFPRVGSTRRLLPERFHLEGSASPHRAVRSGSPAREGRRAQPRLLCLRIDRNKADVSSNRSARVVGGGRAPTSSSCTSSRSAIRALLSHRSTCRKAQADPRAQGRLDLRGLARRELPHGRARKLEAAVDALFRQTGVLRARTLEELIDGRRASLEPATPAGKTRRRDHQRRWPRNPLRRRMRIRRAFAARAQRENSLAARGPGAG